jgi:hypothetical protein
MRKDVIAKLGKGEIYLMQLGHVVCACMESTIQKDVLTQRIKPRYINAVKDGDPYILYHFMDKNINEI